MTLAFFAEVFIVPAIIATFPRVYGPGIRRG
jgi:hypothetical protein